MTATKDSIRRQLLQQVAPLPEIELVEFTPTVAEGFLKGNHGNRNVRPHVVSNYARQMKQGLWNIGESMICVSPEGKLLNGQHRLLAVIESGATVKMYVRWGVAEAEYATMDRGEVRKASDFFAHNGILNGVRAAAFANLVRNYRVRGTVNGSPQDGNKPTPEELLEVWNSIPYAGDTLKSATPIHTSITTVWGMFAFWLIAEGASVETAKEFFSVMHPSCSIPMSNTHPARRLQDLMRNAKSRRIKYTCEETVALVVKAYNAWIEGREVQSLAWRSTEAFPAVNAKGSEK